MINTEQSSSSSATAVVSPLRRWSAIAAALLLVVGLVLAPALAGAACTNCTTSSDGSATVVTFESGTGTFTPPSGVTEVEYLVVAGGGGGGGLPDGGNLGGAGGGGAGGMLTGTLSVTPGNTLNVTVGAGGSGGVGATSQGGNGGDSALGSITASGGGGGASNGVDNDGRDGGSGGGGRVTGNGGSGIAGQGNDGGDGDNGAGGGGGAGSAGADGDGGQNGGNGGSGGSGLASTITGTSATYAAGGDGGEYDRNGTRVAGSDAPANSGNGGGGASGNQGGGAVDGGDGGSGIVVVRYGPELNAEYRMDADGWDGSPGEVIDDSGNGRHGRAQNGADTAGSSPAVSGNPGTCRYGTFDGSDDYVEVSNLSDALDGTASLTFWVRTTQSGNDTAWQAPGITGVEENGGQDDIFWGWLDASGRIGVSVGDDYDSEQKSTTSINDGSWHHVVLTRDASSGQTKVYVDGSLESTGATGAGTIGNTFSSIGRIEDTGGTPEYFAGDLDEVRIYGNVLTTSQVQSIMGATHACGFLCQNADFSDDFEDGGLSPWQTPGGGGSNAGVSTQTAADGQYSMFLQGDEVIARTPNIDLASASSANLSVWVRRGDDSFSNYPESGEDLELQYRTDGNNWATLEAFRGGGTGSEIFERSYDLPNDALHPNFRLRFHFLGGSGGNFDYWHVDNVCLTSTGTGGADHFAVSHDGNAVTCGAEQITITAHNPGDQPTDPGNTTTSLATDTGEGTWARVISGSGTLSDGTAGDGAASYTWPGNGEASVTLAFNYTTVTQAEDPETVNFDVAGGNEGAGEDPDLVVSRSGFRITDGNGNAATVPRQIAGKPSDTAPGDSTLALQAVRASDSDPSVCEPYFSAGDDVEVELGAECDDPATCAGNELAVTNNGNTTSIDTSDDDGANGAASYESVTLRFGSDAQAPLVLKYPDAGRIRLHARYNAIDDGTTSPPMVEYVTGSSNSFVVRPFGFQVAVPSDTSDTGATGSAPFTAGIDFTTTVTARTWQGADDGDSDGVPDVAADLSDNAATPNFGNEATPETAVLSPTVAAPSGGADGTLSNGTFDGFSNGSQTRNDIAWDEVGYVDLAAALGDRDYLASGADVTGRAVMVGRFIPSHFTLSGESLTHRVDLSCGGAAFTYIGEDFGNGFTLTAKAAGGSDTTNYEGAYARLDSAAELDFGATDGSSNLSSRLSASGVTFNWTAGAGSIAAELLLTRQTDEAPYDPLRVGIAPADEDGVALQSTALDLDIDATDSHAETAAPDLRFGRLVVDSAAGAEIAPIDVPVRAEYWTGSTWNLNDVDNCTELELASEVELYNGTDTVSGDQPIAVGSGQTSITSGDPLLIGGTATVTFSAPGAGNTGWVEVTGLLGAGSPDYTFLQGDPDDNGNWNSNPTARVTFGIYSGNDRWIDIRRVPVN